MSSGRTCISHLGISNAIKANAKNRTCPGTILGSENGDVAVSLLEGPSNTNQKSDLLNQQLT